MAGLFCVGFLGRPLTVKGRFLARLFAVAFWVGETTFKTHIRPLPVSLRFRRRCGRDAILHVVWFPAAHSETRHRLVSGFRP
jgi:hypothetical protein